MGSRFEKFVYQILLCGPVTANELAWKLKCRGITVFRYGSKPEQVLYIGEIKIKKRKFVSVESEYAGGCPTKTCSFPD